MTSQPSLPAEGYRQVLQRLDAAVLWLDADGRVLEASQGCRDLLELDPDALLGAPPLAILEPEALSVIAQRLTDEGRYLGLVQCRLPEGDHFTARLRAFSLDATEGAARTLLILARQDGSRQAEQLMRHLVGGLVAATGEEFFRELVRSLAEALHVRWSFIAAVDETGEPAARMQAMWDGERYAPEFAYPLAGTPCEHVVGKRLCHFPARVQERFPDDAWLREAGVEGYMAIPLFDERGRALGHLGIMDDAPLVDDALSVSVLKLFATRAAAVLARLAAERELAARAAALERSNEELDRFAHAASHDLQQPLRQINGYLQLLRLELGDQLDGRQATLFDQVTAGAERLELLIRRLLDHARVGFGTATPEEVELGPVLFDVLADLAAAIEASGASVEIGPLPTVFGDPIQLQRLFQNLVHNATKFGGEAPRIRVSAEQLDGCHRIRVEDDGIGIPADALERVFAPFERAHGSDLYEGSGIGLATCRKIVTRHGGRIWAEPGSAGGTAFVVELPADVTA